MNDLSKVPILPRTPTGQWLVTIVNPEGKGFDLSLPGDPELLEFIGALHAATLDLQVPGSFRKEFDEVCDQVMTLIDLAKKGFRN